MYLTDEQLNHAHHLDQYRWAMNGHEPNDNYFRSEAITMHALVVIDAVSDLMVQAVQLGQSQNGGIHDHLVYGVARRAGDIRLAMREIVQTTPFDRSKPLTTEEGYLVSRALNTIYINVRGTLDNLAYAIIEKHGGLKETGFRPLQVDLFGSKFFKAKAWAGLVDELAKFEPWSVELAKMRNPAAHQIPLAVIRAEMTEAEAKEFQRLHALMLSPLPPGPFDRTTLEKRRQEAADVKRQIDSLGSFHGLFAHRKEDGAMPIYPIIPDDVGTMIRAARLALRYLRD